MDPLQTEQVSAKAPKRKLIKDGIRIGIPAAAIVLIFVVTMILQIVLDRIVRRYAPQIASEGWYVMCLSMVPMYAVAMPLAYLLSRTVPAEPPEKKSMKWYVWLGLMAICFGLTYLGSYIGNIVNTVIGALRGEEVVNEVATLTDATPFWANLLFVGILAPVMEEIFYRKMVIDRLTRYGDLPAILISGIAFGLIHGNFSQFFYAALVGCLFGYIYLNTGKLRYTIGLHMAINLIGGVYSSEMVRRLDFDLLASDPLRAMTENTAGILMYFAYLAFTMIMIMGALIALVLLLVFCRRPLRRAQEPLTAGQWCRVLLCNPAFWIFVLLILFLFLL